ncbi:MAG: hypothetical protein KTR13_04165 [Saprospiraceae bacterium]|nr:hypothetical protein [Saprospiraceae bacterium]
MTLACRYTTQSAFDAGNCSVQFEFFYEGNEEALAATEFKTDDGNTVNVLTREEFDLYATSYDFYFGEAFEKLKQPYTPFNPIPNKAILYSQTNVENQYRVLNSEKLLLRDYTYTANESGAVTNYTINTYNTSTGELINTEEIVLEYN